MLRKNMPFRTQFIVLLLIPLLLLSCGKKGAPTLKSYEKPEKPSLLSAIHREDSIILTWDFPRNKEETITGFVLLKSSGEGFERTSRLGAAERSFNDTDFQDGKMYRYKIVSESLKGVISNESNIVAISPLNTPGPPVDLSFHVADDSLVLGWKSSGEGVLYNVYRSIEKGVYGLAPVNQAPLSEDTFKDIFYMDRKVYYIVRSLINTETRDEGPASEEIAVDPFEFVPPAPREVGYFAAPDRVFLFWKAADERWVTGYRVYRKIGDQEYTLIGETQIPAFLDSEEPLSKRDYRITSLGLKKEGTGTEIKGVIYVPEEEITFP
jgi:hypothetical protein